MKLPTKKTSDKKEETKSEFSWVYLEPRLTEKAAHISTYNVYTFNVASKANKIDIMKAVKEKFKVTPIRVNIVVNKPKASYIRGRIGTRGGGKKAMVYLKKGDTINFV
ncbi:50S ribosomal protein L23 [Candidatus Nomurabacteria bacterium RIFCSPLOWO2_01_FULL_36_10b]|uniref:50S ribosomal protein L23 n=1 Tax=Candidatus Nomurabacteria bacterium RIFCSPLOWO2_01_FULL_36_10b TaxID=1801766 RepID=A0A1F6WPG4_9BACT|nr:MAG: 50S ribosomal protein L23 [Candidatus Nomurabacteria bacterium RIFCSPLOWO2_01_FULL_36_10b]